MTTDNVLLNESMEKLIEYNWEAELRDFQETFEVEIQSQDKLDPWIKWCQIYHEDGRDFQPTQHIFYNLMILKSNYEC